MATNTVLNMIGILLASAALSFSSSPRTFGMAPDAVILTFGILTLVCSMTAAEARLGS